MAQHMPSTGSRRRSWAALILLLTVGAAAPALAQDESRIWEDLFNYQQKMAHIGNAEAQYKLADMYAQGQGTQADPAQARRRLAAKALLEAEMKKLRETPATFD
jgi:TPR repeat protein